MILAGTPVTTTLGGIFFATTLPFCNKIINIDINYNYNSIPYIISNTKYCPMHW
jgi:hypothetical protein